MGAASKFAELHCMTNYSFLRGASHPKELVSQASSLGYSALAITDECSFSGLVRAYLAAQTHQLKLIVGAEFTVHMSAETMHLPPQKLVLLAPSRKAYGQISTLITKLRRRSQKGEYQAFLDDFRWGMQGCLVLWIPARQSADQLLAHGKKIRRIFDRVWISLELFCEAHDQEKTTRAFELSIRLNMPIVASNDVHTHQRERQPMQDVLTAIRLKTTVAELGQRAFPNAERTLRPLEELQRIYPPELLTETACVADLCQFSLQELHYEYPHDLVPVGQTPSDYLRQLTLAGAAERWPHGIPPKAMALINKELALIKQLRYEHYFLTVQDMVQFARSQSILCQGRGSAANSAVCYCLHVTEVDPSRLFLLFERFVSQERDEAPDIDMDFEHERREEVMQYIYRRYGRDRTALAATLITYRPRSAIRDVGKALGLNQDVIDILAKSMAWWDQPEQLRIQLQRAGLDPDAAITEHFLFFVQQIIGFPRHLSQHVGGFVISRGPLAQLVPIENAAMAERTVIQWDKTDLEAMHLMKVDVLALGMLTAIRKTLQTLSIYQGKTWRVQDIPVEDAATYKMLQRGDSVGVFQVESRAQMTMLPRLKPRQFYDLVIEVAIVRPGPIQGDMVHPYLRRRQGLEAVEYPSPEVRGVLERTLGVPIFQEQVIELAMVAAGFTAGEADQLRRAMAAWKRHGGLEPFEQKLIDGMLARNYDRAFADRVFNQIKGFGEYGFPESHAASFALLVYVSAWLKCHQPAAFYCGLLNSLPMGFYSPSQLIQDARRHHIDVRPIDVRFSSWSHTLEAPQQTEQPALRLGLRMVKGFNEVEAGQLIAARRQADFESVTDLAHRAGFSDQSMTFLTRAGALAGLAGHRHQAHWQVAGIERPTALLEASVQHESASSTKMSAPSRQDDMLADYRYTGLTLGPHPMSLLRQHKALYAHRTAAELVHYRHRQPIRVAGLVTGRQRPGTATGVVFLTLEDETGNINVVVWAQIMQKFRAALLQGQLIKVRGLVEREGGVIHVVAAFVEDATHLLRPSDDGTLPFQSRDFH